MTFKGFRKHHKPSSRAASSVMAIMGAMLKVFLPLILITAVAAWVLTHHSQSEGMLRVTTSIPGADIFLDGTMSGLQSDTTVSNVPAGRCIVTVRKPGYASDPEMAVADVKDGQVARLSFVLRAEQTQVRTDSIPPLRHVRQEIFSTGEPIRAVPPAVYRRNSRLVDFSKRERAPSQPGTAFTEPPSDSSGQGSQTQSESSASLDASGIQNAEITVSSTPEGAQIVVNGQTTSRTTPYTFHGLEEGMYIFRLLRPGYLTKPDSIAVVLSSDYQNELAAFELRPDAALPKPTLTIATMPPAAGIKLNGKHVGLGKVALDAAYGSQTIEFADIPGYRTPPPVKVELTTDAPHQDVTGAYEKILGNAYLAVLPAEDLGTKFESGKLRVLVDNELLLDNSKERFDATLMGRILSGKRLVRIEYGDLSDDIHVDLTDGQVSEVSFRVESFFSKRRLRLREKDPMLLEKWEQKSRRLTVLNAS